MATNLANGSFFIVPGFLVVFARHKDAAHATAAEFGEKVSNAAVHVRLDDTLPTVDFPADLRAPFDVGSLVEVGAAKPHVLSTTRQTDALSALYEAWLDAHPHLPRASADEVLAGLNLPKGAPERLWLVTFSLLWDQSQREEDAAARAAVAHIARPPIVDQPLDPPGYAARVAELEDEGMTTSDAQAIADVEFDTLPPLSIAGPVRPVDDTPYTPD